jgi:hypothetical protein
MWGMSKKPTQLSPTQLRVLRLINDLTDPKETWPSHRFYRLPQHLRTRPTLTALERRGLINHTVKRMGGGISHSYWHITEAGRHLLSS